MRTKKGNECVDLNIFRERVEKVTDRAKQQEVEEKAGLRSGVLSRLYCGTDQLHIDHLIKIAAAYDCSIDYLLGRDRMNHASAPTISGADFINAVNALYEMDSVKLIENYEWEGCSCFRGSPEAVTVKSNGIIITNANLNGILRTYSDLRKALDILDADLKESVYQSWLAGIRESEQDISGDTLPDSTMEFAVYGY